ncbi:hypothetical protein WJU16_13420 [Chitinophaga pollutisoli]|uniref:Uncharacterized protein n=1 Tax=Chitinophaga pollutisoli TaxID=3133966 RepID=A0ABZ2YHL0_9BACT
MNKLQMFRKLLRPEALLVLMAVFFYIRQLMAGKEGYTIHFHDTFYLIRWPWWFAPGAMLLLLLAFIYRQTRNYRQIQSLQYFHVLSFIVVPVLTWMLSPGFQPEVLSGHQNGSFTPKTYLPYLGLVMLLFLALGQTAFLANLAIGFIRGKKSAGPVQ